MLFFGILAGQLTASSTSASFAQEADVKAPAETPAPLFKENTLKLSELEIADRLLANARKTLAYAGAFQEKMAALLKAADSYDVENYKKADEELSQISTAEEANYLETMMLDEALYRKIEPPKNFDREKNYALARQGMQQSKLYSLQSSAVFYQCFGLPLQSAHCAKLALNLSRNLNLEPRNIKFITDMLFYRSTAAFWAADYETAENGLKEVLSRDPKHPYAAFFLGETYIARQKYDQAISFLKEALQKESNTELAGHLNQSMALALVLNKKSNEAPAYARQAQKALADDKSFVFKSLALESRGIAKALEGDYAGAEAILTRALELLQLSPLKLGNALEAAQTALWRSYCRKKLGKPDEQDRRYALTVNPEAEHLKNLNTLLSPLFGLKPPIEKAQVMPGRFAIIVGVGNFQDPTIPKLRYPAKDAQDMRAFLINKAGFKSDHIQLLVDKDATLKTLLEKLEGNWLADKMQAGDLLFVFISSHGTPAYPEIGALNSIVSYDTKLAHLFSTSLPMQSLISTMTRRYGKQYSFVVLDTCYAGGLAAPLEAGKTASSPDPELLYVSQHQLFVSSSDKTERSWESKRYPNSIFTRQFLTSLEKNTGSSEGKSDFHSLFQDIARRVNSEVVEDYHHTQNPKLAGRWRGQGIISEKQATTKPQAIGK